MAVHTISLATALLVALFAILLLIVLGPFALLLLILAAILFWYAFRAGHRRTTSTGN
jgi:4-hydroxybenzoate polyprenyltransferase